MDQQRSDSRRRLSDQSANSLRDFANERVDYQSGDRHGIDNPAFVRSEVDFGNRTSAAAAVAIVDANANPKLDKINNRFVDNIVVDTRRDSTVHKCGYGKCSPETLQKLHHAGCLVTVLCFCAITQGFVLNGILPVSISTLEKRFHLSSTQSALFSSMYDIAILLVLVPLCYFGEKGHKGRYLAIGMIIMGIGSFVCALPQFTTGLYDYGQSQLSDTCRPSNGTTTPADAEMCAVEAAGGEKLGRYFYVLLLGQLLQGVGASPLYTLGITYIDENSSQKQSPLFLGLYVGFATVGPALGFIMGGVFLRMYGDIGKVDLSSVSLTPTDPRWYGAWWIGFVIAAISALIFSVPMFSFARELPGAELRRIEDSKKLQTQRRESKAVAFTGSWHEIRISFLELLKNRSFVCLMVMQCAEAFLLNGFVTFIPKLVENLFSLTSSTASLITGAIVVPGGFIGNVLGGYLVRRFKMMCPGSALLALGFQAASGCFILSLLIYCPELNFAGANYAVQPGTDLVVGDVAHQCNEQCQCADYYKPVCHVEQNTIYYSPCRAGCTTTSVVDNVTQWTDCSCLSSSKEQAGLTGPKLGTVKEGVCTTSCPLMPLFFSIFALQVLVTFGSAMPVQQAELRCVPFRLRTLAVGLRWIFVRLIGAIPGNIAFGAAIDKACILWQWHCGERQACLRYDARRTAMSILSFGLSFKVVIVVSLFLAWKLHRPANKSANSGDECDMDTQPPLQTSRFESNNGPAL